MKAKSIIMAAFALLLATGCNGQSNTNVNVNENQNKQAMNKIVIFFSHAGDNYSVGNIEVGNTKIVADNPVRGTEHLEIT